jgi:tetratricopeptide (TPR) repeat protein
MSRPLLGFTSALALLWGASVAEAQQRSIQAECGSVAIGGAAVGNTIKIENVVCNIPPEQLEPLIRLRTRDLQDLSASQRQVISLLEEKLDLNLRQVRAAFEILGEKDIPPERLAAKLVEIAERFRELQATAAVQPGDDLEVAALKREAQNAITAGNLARADEVLADVERAQTAALDRLDLNAAETSAQRGQIALTRLRYVEAARHFGTAASRLLSGPEDKRLGYWEQEASALYRHGDEFGDNDAARLAIERYRQILAVTPRERVPLAWAMTQTGLGNALQTLGGRESGTGRLEEAVAAYRAALQERTRERVPLQWAVTQNNLDLALKALADRTKNNRGG